MCTPLRDTDLCISISFVTLQNLDNKKHLAARCLAYFPAPSSCKQGKHAVFKNSYFPTFFIGKQSYLKVPLYFWKWKNKKHTGVKGNELTSHLVLESLERFISPSWFFVFIYLAIPVFVESCLPILQQTDPSTNVRAIWRPMNLWALVRVTSPLFRRLGRAMAMPPGK